ncbi:MAG TPA: cellulase family glycosylhydrolase [Terriglobales bacterium]|nr:cellulase family glycosylhydrolase [Terriglobales bacterium]
MKNERDGRKEVKASGVVTRRRLLKSAAAIASAAILPSGLAAAALSAKSGPESNPSQTAAPARNPRWYGFNLLEYFSTDADWTKYFPYKNDGMFLEDDFRWIRDWGFNWVRLPMDYRFWTAPDLFTIHEKQIEPIDCAIRLGGKYDIHVNICLHRAPGLCILDTMDEKLTGIAVTKEKTDVFTDPHTLDAFVHQWTFFADRYKGIPSQRLSFNLVNEPIVLPNESEVAELQKHGGIKTADYFDAGRLQRHAEGYSRVAKAASEAIRARDPQRLVVTDGYPGGGSPIPDLFDTGMLQSCHTYNPIQLTHHNCEWVRGLLTGSEPMPTWPLKDDKDKVICDRSTLENLFHPWAGLAAKLVPIHFGEMGCYKHTPPDVVLAWFNDTLDILSELNSGWALWNFRGPFGVLDTERAGTKFEEWHGHKLDRPLLALLQKKMKT